MSVVPLGAGVVVVGRLYFLLHSNKDFFLRTRFGKMQYAL
jgi:hypothetical protein